MRDTHYDTQIYYSKCRTVGRILCPHPIIGIDIPIAQTARLLPQKGLYLCVVPIIAQMLHVEVLRVHLLRPFLGGARRLQSFQYGPVRRRGVGMLGRRAQFIVSNAFGKAR